MTGETYSSNFPTVNPYDDSLNSYGYCDIFVTKFSPVGNSLIYSTYLGGKNYDIGSGIAVDGSGSAYVTGYTYSSDFPIVNPYDGSLDGSKDVFVTKISPAGNSLTYSTFLGGDSWDSGYGIAVDGSSSAYLAGCTGSRDFPTVNPYQGSYNGSIDVFLTKISPAGNSLTYSTYLGGDVWDFCHGIAVDGLGSTYVTGYTYSNDFPTVNHYDGRHNGVYDVFVAKFDIQTSINCDELSLPSTPELKQNFPNPFNNFTTIYYNLPNDCHVVIKIYDILGRKLKTLINKERQAGYHQVMWNADGYTSGVYFYKLQADDYIETKKMVLLK